MIFTVALGSDAFKKALARLAAEILLPTTRMPDPLCRESECKFSYYSTRGKSAYMSFIGGDILFGICFPRIFGSAAVHYNICM